jgi:hypothetical protein
MEDERRENVFNVKKKGGTIFSQKDNRYKAVCGAETPCSLHIELYRGYFAKSISLLEDYTRLLEKSKENIIRLQHGELFHFQSLDKVKRTFEDEKAYYETLTNLFTDLEKCIFHNDDIDETLRETIEQLNRVIIEIRTLISDFISGNDKSMLELAMKQQIEQLIPLTEQLRQLRYEVTEEDVGILVKTMEYMREGKMVVEKRNSDVSTFIQRVVSLEKEEINLKEDPKVVKWVYHP